MAPFDSPNAISYYCSSSTYIDLTGIACTVSEVIAAEVQNPGPTCSVSHWFSSVEIGITGHYDTGQLPRVGSQDTTVVCQFPLFVALCDHNPPTLQTDRQTDGRTSCS